MCGFWLQEKVGRPGSLRKDGPVPRQRRIRPSAPPASGFSVANEPSDTFGLAFGLAFGPAAGGDSAAPCGQAAAPGEAASRHQTPSRTFPYQPAGRRTRYQR